MFHLIKKDLIIQKHLLLLYLIMLTIFIYFQNSSVFIIVLISAIMTLNSFYYDDFFNAHKLMNALPFTRQELVSAKFIGIIVFTSATMIVFMIVRSILNGGIVLLAWQWIVFSLALAMFYGALYIPLIYKLANQNLISIFLFIYVVTAILIPSILDYINEYFPNIILFFYHLPDSQLYSLLLLISVIFYLLSWRLSIKIYEEKEL